MWPASTPCAIASASPLDARGLELIGGDLESYRHCLFAGPKVPLYLYRIATPGCP